MSDLGDVWGGVVDPQAPVPAGGSGAVPNETPAPATVDDVWNDMAQTKATGAVLDAQGVNPDQAKQALDLSKQLNAPRETIESNLPQYQQQAITAQGLKTVQNSPVVAQWLAENSPAAKLAQDDFNKLDTVGKLASTLVQSVKQPLIENQIGRAGFTKQLQDLAGISTTETDKQIADLRQQMAAYSQVQPTGAYKVAGFVGQQAVNLLDNAISALPEVAGGAAIGGAAGSSAAGVGAIPGAVAGAGVGLKTGMALDMARVAGGQTYLQLLDMKDADGNPLSPAARHIGASTVAALTFGIGFGGLGLQGDAAQNAAKSFLGDATKQILARPTVVSMLANTGKNVALGSLEGGAMMGALAATQQAGQEIAKQISPGQWQTVFNDPNLRQQYLDQITDAAETGAAMFGLLHGVGGVLGEYGRIQQSNVDIARFQSLEQASIDSKLRARDADTFADFLKSQTGGSPVENLYVPHEAVRQLYQSLQTEPGAANDPFKFQTDMQTQLDQAAATGGDIVIPTSDYIAHLAGSDVSGLLRDNIKARPDGYTLNESRTFYQGVADQLRQAAGQVEQNVAEANTPTSAIAQDYAQQLRDTGKFSEDYIRDASTTMAKRVAVRAARLGLTPEQLHAEQPIKIQTGKEATAGRTFNQGSVEDLNQRIAAIPGVKILSHGDNNKPTALRVEFNDKNRDAVLPRLANYADASGKEVHVRQAVDDEAGTKYEDGSFATPVYNVDLTGRTIDAKMQKAIDASGLQAAPRGDNKLEVYYAGHPDDAAAISDFERRVLTLNKSLGGSGATVEYGTDRLWQYGRAENATNPETITGFGGAGAEAAKSFSQGRRGSITFDGAARIIDLFQKADTSTLLHESGHAWLEELKADAMRPDAPQQIRDDWATIAKAIDYVGGDISDEGHEKFAGMAERYFMEGKAPSLDLSDAFSRFKDWLLGIYKTLRNTNLPSINDDVREVFDRLLATDDEIANAEAVQNLKPAFATKEAAGMTDAEFAAYQRIAARARASATGELMDKMMADIRKSRTAEYKKRFNEARPDVEKEINARPDIRALHFLRTGKLLDAGEGEAELPKMKLDRESVEQLKPNFDPDEMLPNGIITKGKDGFSPDDVAPLLGYDNGTKLINDMTRLRFQENALKGRGIKKSLREYLTDRATDDLLRQRDGDTMNDESIRDEAMRGLHDQTYGEMIGAETAAMARQVGAQAIPYKAALDWSRGVIADKKLSDAVRLSVYASAEARAGRAVERALMAGDRAEAFRQKQQQMLNHALYRAGQEARDDLVKAKRLFDRYAKNPVLKAVDQRYTDQIHGLLQRFGYAIKRGADELQRAIDGNSLKDFIQDRYENGREIPVADWLLTSGPRKLEDFTTSEFRDLKDTITALNHNGRDEKTLTVDEKRVAKDEVMSEIVKNILDTHKAKETSKFLNPNDAGKLRGSLDKFTSALRAADAELLKPENFLDWLDKRDILGPLNQHVFRPLKEAQGREYDLLADTAKSFREMKQPKDWHKTLGDMVDQDKLLDPEKGTPYAMSRKTMLSIALNMGNDGNIKRLTQGHGWNEGDIRDFLNQHMTKADFDFVQHAWGTFEKLKPQIDDMQRRLTGVGLDMVEAKPLDTPFGRYEGGYYPIVYDPVMSKRALSRESAATSENIFEKDYYRPTTAKGHTITRSQNYTDRLLLSTDVLPSKLKQAIHDLAFREAIINADKIISDPRFKKTIMDTWGAEYYKELRPWLRDVANAPNVDDRPLSFIDKALRYSRMTMVEMGVGFRTTTMLKHGSTAFANSIGEIGAKNMAAGMAEYYSNRSAKRDFVYDRSAEMRHRMAQYDRDIRENLKSLMGEEQLTQTIRRAGHYGVAFLDMESAMPTWIGAYRSALNDGLEDKDAIYAADKAVRNAHGAQSTVDQAGIQRGPEYKKMFSMFYGFFNHMYNRERDTYRIAKDGVGKLVGGDISGARRDFVTTLTRSMAYLLAPAIVEAAVSGQSKPDDESWGRWAAGAITNQLAATVPVVRDVSNYLEYGKGPESPMSRFVEAMGAEVKDVTAATGLSDKEVSSKWLKHAIETPGYLIGLPTGQLATSAQYLWDVHNGDQDPEDVQDWMHGLIYGKQGNR